MDLVLCHATADFDTLGAAVGAACLRPGSRIVLTGGAHPGVQAFLALWRDEYPLIEPRAVQFEQVRSITLVDAHSRDRFPAADAWFREALAANLPIYIYDHHIETQSLSAQTLEGQSRQVQHHEAPRPVARVEPEDLGQMLLPKGADKGGGTHPPTAAMYADFPTAEVCTAEVGAATTLVVEALQAHQIIPTPTDATVMALGIHGDTGSLVFEQSTDRDAAALAWLMAHGANQQVIAEYHEPGLSPQLQVLLKQALDQVVIEPVRGHRLAWVKLETAGFIPGLSGLAEQLIALLRVDTLLLWAHYPVHDVLKAVVIGRSHPRPLLPSSVNLQPIFAALGGGGHAQAASAMLKGEPSEDILDQGNGLNVLFEQLLRDVRSQIPPPAIARDIMSSPVRTILPVTSVDEAQRILLRYGHAGLCVVDGDGVLKGIISRRDIDIALRHGLGHGPVKGCMSTQLKTISPQTSILDAQALMMTYDVGRLPVVQADQLLGIVTRTDLLRQLHQLQLLPQQAALQATPQATLAPHSRDSTLEVATQSGALSGDLPPLLPPPADHLYRELSRRLLDIWPALMLIAEAADQRGWSLYVVGGAVRDLLLSMAGEPYPLTDIDLVVDGAEAGAGVTLAETIQATYPDVELQVHGQFQTAALIWHLAVSSEAAPSRSPNSQQGLPAEPGPPLLIDIATARTEFYPYPAANPEVEASTIRQDLYRRDFTINAMAIQLNGAGRGSLLDFFGGWQDLQKQQVRVLHANSFIEDPTRIFRAVRFALRLGFTLDVQTEQFIRYAISSGIYAQVQASEPKTPALQSRLKAELKYLLEAARWEASLALIERLGALACLHSTLEMTPVIWKQIRRMDRWLRKFEARSTGRSRLPLSLREPRWLMLLELLIAQAAPALRPSIAMNLNLGEGSINRLRSLHLWEARLLETLPHIKRPSQIHQQLHQYQTAELLLMGDRHPYTLGPQIWQYIVRLSQMPTLINGDTLKQLGYKPGPQFRDILSAVHHLTLDGELASQQAAEAYVLTHYAL